MAWVFNIFSFSQRISNYHIESFANLKIFYEFSLSKFIFSTDCSTSFFMFGWFSVDFRLMSSWLSTMKKSKKILHTPRVKKDFDIFSLWQRISNIHNESSSNPLSFYHFNFFFHFYFLHLLNGFSVDGNQKINRPSTDHQPTINIKKSVE